MLWAKNEKHKIKIKSGLEVPFMAVNKESPAQIKALKSDGERPANQTNNIRAIILMT